MDRDYSLSVVYEDYYIVQEEKEEILVAGVPETYSLITGVRLTDRGQYVDNLEFEYYKCEA